VKRDLRVLGDRHFRYLFLARTVSLLGSAIAPIALAFAVLDMRGGSASALGLVLAARSLAQIILLLFGGVLADRLPRFRLMVGSDLVSFVAQAGVAALFITGVTPLGVVVALSALNGAAAAIFFPASRGVVPQVVPKELFQPANALLRLTQNSSSIVGAAVAGVLVLTIGPGWALAIDALSFALSAALLAGVRLDHQARPATSTVLADLRDGWRQFSSRRWIWLVVVQFAVVNGCFGAVNVLGPLIAKRHLGGAGGWSAVLTAESIGLVAGSLVAMRLRPRFPIRAATIATLGFLPPFFLLALHAPVWAVAASMLANGVCVDIFEVLWDTSLQNHVPHDALSRISSYDAVGSFALGPICLAVAGPLADAVGVTQTLVGAGALATVVSLGTLASRSVRTLPPTADTAGVTTAPAATD
jgi:MFS family permease